MTKLQQIESLLNLCEADLSRMHAIRQELQTIEANRKLLAAYYSEEYPKDYDTVRDTTEHLRILDQDSIWNVLDEQYQEKISLVKDLVNSI